MTTGPSELRPALESAEELIRTLLDDNGDQLADADFFSKLQELRHEHKRALTLLESVYKERLFERTAQRVLAQGGQRINSMSILDNGDQSDQNDQYGQYDQYNRYDQNDQHKIGTRNKHQRDGGVHFDDEWSELKEKRSSDPFNHVSPVQSVVSDHDRSESGGDSSLPRAWAGDKENSGWCTEGAVSAQYLHWEINSRIEREERAGAKEAKELRSYGEKQSMKFTGNGLSITGHGWRPKCTVPEPFRMTIRDEIAPIKASYSENFLQQQLKEREEGRRVEKAGFRAKPVPPSTHMPLYEEMIKKDQERRRFLQEYSSEILKMKVKPFNLTNSSIGDHHRRRCRSVSDLRRSQDEDVVVFKATPLPNYLKNGTSSSQSSGTTFSISNSRFRKVEQRQHSAQAVHHSTIRKALQSKRRHQQQPEPSACTFTPQIVSKVPDFERLQNKFQQSLEEAKLKGSHVTVPEPFNLRIQLQKRIPHHHDTQKNTMKGYHSGTRRSRSMSNLNSTENGNTDAVVKANTAALLREAAIKRRLDELEREGAKLMQSWQQRKEDGRKIKEQMRAKMINYDLSKEAKERERIEQRKLANQASQEFYSQFKRSISEKISERQCLLDRQNLLLAKQSIDKRYRKALEAAGLKGASVETAMASIEKLLSRDSAASAAVSAVLGNGTDPVRSASSHSSAGSGSPVGAVTSDRSSSAVEESVNSPLAGENIMDAEKSDSEEHSDASQVLEEEEQPDQRRESNSSDEKDVAYND